MRERILILTFALGFIFVYSLLHIAVISIKNRPIKPHPLPLKIVEWASKFHVRDIFVVDLDADGCSELLVEDHQSQLWWAEWTGKQPSFERVPIFPKDLLRFDNWQKPPQLLVGAEGNSLCLVTRSGNDWEKVYIPLKRLPPAPMSWSVSSRAGLLDLDEDSKYNDVLVLSDIQRLEWWQRVENGEVILKDCLRLPRQCEYLSDVRGGRVWKFCQLWLVTTYLSNPSVRPLGAISQAHPQAPSALPLPQPIPSFPSHAFVSEEKGKLRWKGTMAEEFHWTDADIDGDGKKERIEWWKWHYYRNELVIQFANGWLQVLALPPKCSILIEDLDGNRQSEILIYDRTRSEKIEIALWQFEKKGRKLHQQRKEFVSSGAGILSPFYPYPSIVPVLDKLQSSDWSFLITAEKNKHLQVERWWVSNKGWQSECIAVLPKPKTEGGDLSVIWTGNELVTIERRHPPLWLIDLRHFFRDALREIGLNSFVDRPLTFPPSRIWGWHSQKHRWLLLGYAFATEGGELWKVTPLGNGKELAIIWWSLPKSVNVGVFRNGMWQVNRLKKSLDYEMTRRLVLWDGSQYWTILCDGKNFVAFTEP